MPSKGVRVVNVDRSETEMNETASSTTWGALARLPLVAFLVTLCVVAGVKLVRAGQGSLMQEGLCLSIDPNDPFWQLFLLVGAIVVGVAIPLWCISWRNRRRETDFTRGYEGRTVAPAIKPDEASARPLDGVLLVPDASVLEVNELVRLFKAEGIRFALRQTVIDTAFHRRGNGGLGTRMCVAVHPSDVARAQPLVDKVLNPGGVLA